MGKIDDELFLVQWCDINAQMKRFTLEWIILQLLDLKAVMLNNCLNACRVHYKYVIGINALNMENCKILVGIGTDGASVNMG